MSKMKKCKSCGATIAKNVKMCPECGTKNISTSRKVVGILIAIVGIALIINGISGTGDEPDNVRGTTPDEIPIEFKDDCGVLVSAEIGKNIINLPQITTKIKNNTDKKIIAIEFYSVPFDVYGERITGGLVESNLGTDEAISGSTIAAGESITCSWQLLDTSTYDTDLYIYSVYFEDGTQWGDKDATVSQILKYGVKVDATPIE